MKHFFTYQILSFLTLTLTLASAPAALLQFEGAPTGSLSAAGVSVPVHTKAKTRINGVEKTLYLTGAGIYRKPVAFLSVPVLIATHYTDLPSGLDSKNPMKSIRQAKVKAIQLTATMSLNASEVRDLIEQALDTNEVDLSDPRIQDAVGKVTFGPNRGEAATMMGVENADGTQTVSIEFLSDLVHSTSKEIADLVWLVWFGKPLDAGIEKLKEGLVSGH